MEELFPGHPSGWNGFLFTEENSERSVLNSKRKIWHIPIGKTLCWIQSYKNDEWSIIYFKELKCNKVIIIKNQIIVHIQQVHTAINQRRKKYCSDNSVRKLFHREEIFKGISGKGNMRTNSKAVCNVLDMLKNGQHFYMSLGN